MTNTVLTLCQSNLAGNQKEMFPRNVNNAYIHVFIRSLISIFYANNRLSN